MGRLQAVVVLKGDAKLSRDGDGGETPGIPRMVYAWLVVWNMVFYDFPYIYTVIVIPTDFHIFQRV